MFGVVGYRDGERTFRKGCDITLWANERHDYGSDKRLSSRGVQTLEVTVHQKSP